MALKGKPQNVIWRLGLLLLENRYYENDGALHFNLFSRTFFFSALGALSMSSGLSAIVCAREKQPTKFAVCTFQGWSGDP